MDSNRRWIRTIDTERTTPSVDSKNKSELVVTSEVPPTHLVGIVVTTKTIARGGDDNIEKVL